MEALARTFGEQPVRVFVRDGEPWFATADVCRILEIGNVSQAITRLDDDERTLISGEGLPAAGLGVVSEAGLYALVLGSRKPEAKAFKRWVTHEVLPSIRKTGSYVAPTAPSLDLASILDSKESTLLLMAEALKRVDVERGLRLAAENKAETLAAEVQTKTTALAIVTPKAEVFDAFIDSNGLYLLMNAARALHQPPKLFIAALREANILGYEHGELVARAHYTDAKDANGVPMGKGYFTHRPYTFDRSGGTPDSRLQVYVTPLGLAWLGRCVTSGRLVIESKSKRARARAQRGAAA